MRPFLLISLVLLLVPAGAGAKSGWEADRDWQTLVPGQRADVKLTAIEHESGATSSRFEGKVPTLVFLDDMTGRAYTFRGGPADGQGVAVVPVTLPHPSLWEITVKVDGRLEGGWPPADIKGPAKAAAPVAARKGAGDGPPTALLVGAVVAALLAGVLTVQRIRRPRLGGT
jgi:hypothetical protein